SAIPLGGTLDQSKTDLSAQAIRGQVSFNRRLNDKHEIIALTGAEVREISLSSESTKLYGYNDRVISFSPVKFNTQFPTYFGSNGTISDPYSISEKLDRFVSLYGNASYAYLGKY